MSNLDNKYKAIPFWSWNDELDPKELCKQIEWMHENDIGGFFMHARGGLTTPYLGDKWFECVEACLKKAKELNMEAYAYDENGWPSGFGGGKLLEDPLNCDMYLTTKEGHYDPKSCCAFDISGDKAIKVNDGEKVLNIYLNTSNSTADICNKDVIKKFIDMTHEEYKKHDIYGNLRGFFTDEPQYYRANTPFTRVLPKYFMEHYNEDVFDSLALLFVDKEGYQDFRYKYYKALQDLMLDSFGKQIYEWCDKNGYKLTGHYCDEVSMGAQIMCCGGVMPFYEYEHIPGVDHLGRNVEDNVAWKQLGSVVAQLNKKQAICEMFACVGWDATPLELKKIAEHYLNGGISLVCHHLLPYKEHGQRKRDYPEHYSKINPWVEKGFKDFNEQFNKIGELITKSHEIVEVGVLHPIRSAYFSYKRNAEDFGVKYLDDCLIDINKRLVRNGVQYHLLDEVIMAKHAHVDGNSLVIGDFKYKYIIIPEGTLTMDKSTQSLFEEYAKNGGKFYIVKDAPSYLEGQPFNHCYMKNNCTFDEIIASKPFYSSENDSIRLAYREIDGTNIRFIYALNLKDECDITIKVPGFSSFICDGKILDTELHFNKAESKILYFSREKSEKSKKNSEVKLCKNFKVIGTSDNYFTLDYPTYSTDGKSYSKPLHYMCIFNMLLESRYQGDVYLKYNFEVKDIPSDISVLIEDTNIKDVSVNGQVIKKTGTILEKDLWSYELTSKLIKGQNEIIVKINFFESEQVYYALFGENVQETLKNCLVYDTTIEAIYLKGNFGVFGDFKDGEQKDIVIGSNFYIGVPKHDVTCLIKDGYPFFRGEIALEQTLEVDNINKTLVIDERFQLIDLYVNDCFVKRMMFDYKVDLSDYLKIGKNKIQLNLIVSNRNLLGPHHFVKEEPLAISPFTFERTGTWKEDGTSCWCVDRYSFVKTII